MTAVAAAPAPEAFRECSTTGLKINAQAEALIKVNAVAATVSLLIGGIAAVLVLLTRWQVVHLLSAEWFYRVLTVHGMSMLIFFIIFFEMAVLYFASAVLLNSRVATPRLAWASFWLMVGGALLVEWMMWTGKADVLFTSYVPLRAHPLYYLGIILFAVGALIVSGIFFATLVVAKRERTYEGSVPLVTFGAATAAIIAVITLLHGAAIYIPTFLWSLGLMHVDPQIYRMIWWGLGHSSQQINVAAMVSLWYLLGALTIGAVVLNEKISRTAFVLYVLFISMAAAHHLLVDPGLSPAWKVWNTSYAMYLAVLASMVHGFTIPAGMEASQRLRGLTKGMFEWLRKAPWSDPGFSALIFSIIIFGFLGGITGVTFGTEQINLIAHNTFRVPAHFHATVVGGTALAFMGITYYVIPLIFRKQVAFWPLVKVQPYLFAIGMTIFAVAGTFAGTFGLPRRHWDTTFSQAPFDVQYHPAVNLMVGIMAIGGLIAAVGGAIYLVSTVWSVFFGKSIAALSGAEIRNLRAGIPAGILRPPPPLPAGDVDHRGLSRGTLVLVGVFLLAFIAYYFVNWKLLSVVWKVG
ncbi:MAG TPA: cbb3-type cytochrome c oxidase subunit I [Gemmatimonadales bacterium]|nr:cbb3-type cytochrome c oxidase subunit I [Gemmatimonadales bacterium]